MQSKLNQVGASTKRDDRAHGPAFPAQRVRRPGSKRARRAKREKLDAILLFAQESLYYLTGFDTSGFVFFQCAVLTAGSERDRAAHPPAGSRTGAAHLDHHRCAALVRRVRGRPLPGTEGYSARRKSWRAAASASSFARFGLTADKYELVRRRLEGWCELVDASHLVRNLRMVKSPAEIAYVRKAAELADRSLEAMLAAAKPGAFEGDIAAAGAVPILAGGGDPPPSGPVLGSGDRALLVRSATGFRHLDPVDQLDDGVRRQLSALLRLPDAHRSPSARPTTHSDACSR